MVSHIIQNYSNKGKVYLVNESSFVPTPQKSLRPDLVYLWIETTRNYTINIAWTAQAINCKSFRLCRFPWIIKFWLMKDFWGLFCIINKLLSHCNFGGFTAGLHIDFTQSMVTKTCNAHHQSSDQRNELKLYLIKLRILYINQASTSLAVEIRNGWQVCCRAKIKIGTDLSLIILGRC